MVHCASRSHASVYGPCCLCRPCWCRPFVHIAEGPMLQIEAMLMSVIFAATWDHVDDHGPCYHQRTCGCLWPGLHFGACSPCWCPQSMLLLSAMLVSVDGDAAKSHVDVCDLCCSWKSCLHPQFVLPPEAMCCCYRNASFAVVPTTSDSYLRMRDIEGFCGHLSLHHAPPPPNRQEAIKEFFKNCNSEAEV